ncbi:MAG TPA: ferredoxin--NADP reductase [Rhodocyclaceae bacterium]|nr:ferredoxin--NADP reductase [Rhodocyclaceae bacterium]
MNEPATNRWTTETITSIHRWTDALWSLRIIRPAAFRFQPGHYVRLGLPVDAQESVWRPYSLVSAPNDNALEILLVLIPGGAFTSQLMGMQAGDAVLLDRSCFGFFLADQLTPGRTLWMLATGTGLGPYMSMLRDGAILNAHERVIVVHSVRVADELAYADELSALQRAHGERIQYIPVVTREPIPGTMNTRIPQLIQDNRLQSEAEATFDPTTVRVMVCGNPDFTAEMRRLLVDRKFLPCRRNAPGSMLFEKYW